MGLNNYASPEDRLICQNILETLLEQAEDLDLEDLEGIQEKIGENAIANLPELAQEIKDLTINVINLYLENPDGLSDETVNSIIKESGLWSATPSPNRERSIQHDPVFKERVFQLCIDHLDWESFTRFLQNDDENNPTNDSQNNQNAISKEKFLEILEILKSNFLAEEFSEPNDKDLSKIRLIFDSLTDFQIVQFATTVNKYFFTPLRNLCVLISDETVKDILTNMIVTLGILVSFSIQNCRIQES